MEFILASTNEHKAEELDKLLSPAGIKVISAPEKLDVVEDGESFEENAFIKAKAYYNKFKKPTLADDSGLVVEALPDLLGIYSARFAPELPDYKDKNLKLIELLEGKERDAYFVCYLCFYRGEGEVFSFEGRVHGQIGQERKGEHGFGYDPVFEPTGQSGKSLAELPDWKMANSHRAKASLEAVKFFKNQN